MGEEVKGEQKSGGGKQGTLTEPVRGKKLVKERTRGKQKQQRPLRDILLWQVIRGNRWEGEDGPKTVTARTEEGDESCQ